MGSVSASGSGLSLGLGDWLDIAEALDDAAAGDALPPAVEALGPVGSSPQPAVNSARTRTRARGVRLSGLHEQSPTDHRRSMRLGPPTPGTDDSF
jgi:hypothetical protein